MKVYLFFLLILATSLAKAQVLTFDTLVVSKVVYQTNYNILADHYFGPSVYCVIEVANTTDTTLFLHPSKSTIFMQFSYKGKDYTGKAGLPFSLLTFYEKEELCIEKGGTYQLKFGTSIFLGTEILTDLLEGEKKDVYDYSLEILQVLPTLRIVYEEEGFRLSSCGINNVTVERYYYTPE